MFDFDDDHDNDLEGDFPKYNANNAKRRTFAVKTNSGANRFIFQGGKASTSNDSNILIPTHLKYKQLGMEPPPQPLLAPPIQSNYSNTLQSNYSNTLKTELDEAFSFRDFNIPLPNTFNKSPTTVNANNASTSHYGNQITGNKAWPTALGGRTDKMNNTKLYSRHKLNTANKDIDYYSPKQQNSLTNRNQRPDFKLFTLDQTQNEMVILRRAPTPRMPSRPVINRNLGVNIETANTIKRKIATPNDNIMYQVQSSNTSNTDNSINSKFPAKLIASTSNSNNNNNNNNNNSFKSSNNSKNSREPFMNIFRENPVVFQDCNMKYDDTLSKSISRNLSTRAPLPKGNKENFNSNDLNDPFWFNS